LRGVRSQSGKKTPPTGASFGARLNKDWYNKSGLRPDPQGEFCNSLFTESSRRVSRVGDGIYRTTNLSQALSTPQSLLIYQTLFLDMSNMRISPLFKRLLRKLRLKKKEPSQDEPVPKNAFDSSPTVETALAPGHHFATNPPRNKPQSPRNKPPRNRPPSPRNKPPPITDTSSGSVTLAERVRYQKMVLGMSDAQIASALPPGQYTIVFPPSMPPSGPGHLAYAYYESAS
jgi:hypothetical protein